MRYAQTTTSWHDTEFISFVPEAYDASSGRSRASSVCLALLTLATLWLSTRPYVGVIHDSRFYTVQALSALSPGRFADDLYFHYGSQDQFTLFTLVYKPVLAALGIAKAAMVLTIAGQCFWIAGLVYLARGMFQDGLLALIAVIMAVALPGGLLFNYGEQFLTPRLFAEAMTLWAFGAILRGRSVRALLLLGVSATIHPLMTLPGLAVLFVHEAVRWRIRWALAALAVITSVGLAFAGVQPFVRLAESFDPAWFAVVRVRDFFCLLGEWTCFQWLQAGGLLVMTAVGLSGAEPRERRFCLSMLVVASGGLAVTLVGGDLLHNVLAVDVQQYRATWPLAVVANLLFGALLLRIRWSVISPLTQAALVAAVVMLVVSKFIALDLAAAVPVVAFAGLLVIRERARRGPMPESVYKSGCAILGFMCGAALYIAILYLILIANQTSLCWQTLRGLGISLTSLGMGTVYLTVSRRVVTRPLIVFAVALAAFAAFSWDQRTPWTKFIETADVTPASLASLLPEQKSVYWEGDVRVPWFVLKRPSYFSCAQGTGALFFRNTAIAYQHRYETFQPLRTIDFGQETSCPAPQGPESVAYNRKELVSICAKEPELGALVLTRPVANAPARVWISPAKFEDWRLADGKDHVVMTDRFFIYSCADLQ
jgi:hypothetical protein